jgi:hypothetical protein
MSGYPHICIVVVAKNDTPWAIELANGTFPTSHATVNQLMQQYALTMTDVFSSSDQLYLTFTSVEPLNTVALAKRWTTISGVTNAQSNTAVGDGNNIIYQQYAGYAELTYSVGWGDCPSGCIYYRQWTFRVNNDCSVVLKSVEGFPLTDEVPCNGNFQCFTEPFCQNWLRDSVQVQLNFQPECDAPFNYGVFLRRFEQFGQPIWGIETIVGTDYSYISFYDCGGQFLGRCDVSIIGVTCTPPNVANFMPGTTVWDCSQPIPPLDACSITNTKTRSTTPLAVRLLPNPTADVVRVQADLLLPSAGHIRIFDVWGRIVREIPFDTQKLSETIDCQSLVSGIYFVEVMAGNQKATQRLVRE